MAESSTEHTRRMVQLDRKIAQLAKEKGLRVTAQRAQDRADAGIKKIADKEA